MVKRTAPHVLYYDTLAASLPDLSGKVVAITGCTSGMGLVLAETAAGRGASVIMLNRPSDRAEAALARVRMLGEARFVACDLTSFASVRAAGQALRGMLGETGLDMLVNNAGLMGLPDRATEDGFDVQMQANHLGHFLLVSEVWPLLDRAASLREEARVVNHSSGARNAPKRALERRFLEPKGGDLGGDRWPGMGKWVRYQQSKRANLLFTYALQNRAEAREGNRVKVLCAHPGPCDSGLQAKTAGTTVLDRYILRRTLNEAQSLQDGTCGLARAAFEPGVRGGQFYGPDAVKRTGPAELLPEERNPEAEAMLWEASLKATGVKDFFGE